MNCQSLPLGRTGVVATRRPIGIRSLKANVHGFNIHRPVLSMGHFNLDSITLNNIVYGPENVRSIIRNVNALESDIFGKRVIAEDDKVVR